ncbi:MAG: SRPBCC family protein [Hyphomicrobium sp.]
MLKTMDAKASSDRDLILERIIDAPRANVYRCWTEPELMKQWFTPRPYTTPVVEADVRPGGSNFILMKSPAGHEMPNHGVYLEVVPNERLVFTDAYTHAWQPSAKPFMTVVLTFADAGPEHGPNKTKYTAVVHHWTAEDCASHEKMGFHRGWGIAADQLEALAKTL